MSSSISSAVNQHIQPIQTQLNNRQTNHQQQINNFMSLITTMVTSTANKFSSIQSSLQQLGASAYSWKQLGLPAQAPSEANSPHGVGR